MKPEIDYSLYLVTDRDLMSTSTLELAVEQAIEGGSTIIQLREKRCSSLDFFNIAVSIKRITEKYQVPLIINDRVDIAIAVDAEGVHIGQNDLPCSKVRDMIGQEKIVGVSVSTYEEAEKAKEDGADYLGIGAMFATDTKTDACQVSIEEIKKIKSLISLPVVAIGGINKETILSFIGTGIDGVAVVSAIISVDDITAARDIKEMFLSTMQKHTLDFDAAIFDLDGTLIDSMDVWERIDVEFLKKRNLSMPETYIEELCSMSFKEAASYTIHLFNLDESADDIIEEWNQMAIDEYSYRIPLKPNVKEYILFLKQRGIKLGVATALPKDLYEPVLKNNGIYDLFDALTSTDEVGCGKDCPDVYLLAAKKLNTNPKDCIVFEDVFRGINGIISAGMRAYGVYDKYSEYEQKHIQEISEGYIYDFAEMLI